MFESDELDTLIEIILELFAKIELKEYEKMDIYCTLLKLGYSQAEAKILELIENKEDVTKKVDSLISVLQRGYEEARVFLKTIAFNILDNPSSNYRDDKGILSKIMRDMDISEGLSHKEKLKLVDKINAIYKPSRF